MHESESEAAQSCPTLSDMGCHFLLQGVFRLRHGTNVSCISCIACRFFTTEASHLGSPNINMLLLLSRFRCVRPTRLHRPWDSPDKNSGVGCHFLLQCMKVKSEREVAQSCPTLCDSMDCSLPGSSFHGIFQARVLEWVAIGFSKILT